VRSYVESELPQKPPERVVLDAPLRHTPAGGQ
jgi:hypothetical protein